ncbi:MAG: hypothetical protein IJV87_00265 [Clostridia bacterium]|nr:hypothetical protein [Clostridia bacterium]
MSKKTIKYIKLIYGIALSVLLIISGALLMLACFNIYNIGNRPFTPENISAEFKKISIFIWLTVDATIGGIILKLALPSDEGKLKASKDKKATLFRLMQKLNEEACDQEKLTLIKKEQKLRIILRAAAIALCVVTALPALIYSLNFNNFGADYNASVISACLWVLPCAFISMGICIALVYLENASIDRQSGYVKAALAESKGSFCSKTDNKTRSNSEIAIGVRITLAVVALALIVAGILNGGMADVLSKAINICTECIGLG